MTKAPEQKFVLHEGLIDLERMRLWMFKTVVRYGVAVLWSVFWISFGIPALLLLWGKK